MRIILEPSVFLIGRTMPNRYYIKHWLDHLGADEYVLPDDCTPGEALVNLCGKRCYMSFSTDLNRNLSRVRTDMSEFIDNILKVGHGNVIEHVVYNFAIEDVTRVFTAEMNRHRAGMAISEGSMRFIRFDDIKFLMPRSLQVQEGDITNIIDKKLASQEVFQRAFIQDEDNYKELEHIWASELSPTSAFKEKKAITSMMRRIVGMGVCTGGVWSGNLRALRHVFNMRCDGAAEEEILSVANLMLEKMMEAEPSFFKDFKKDDKGFWRAGYVKV